MNTALKNGHGGRRTPARSTPVEGLANLVGASARSDMVYGEPVERNGVTVIPVATVRFGFGGGFSHKESRDGDGGGGGGVKLTPIGYIEIKDGTSEFRRIIEPTTVIRAIVFGGFLGFLFLRPLLRRRRS